MKINDILKEADYDPDNEDEAEQAEMRMMKELEPIKEQLQALLKKYPHAMLDDILDWLHDTV